MARQAAAVEVNKFNAGLITDASPLTAPDNSSLEEDNMVLNLDGSRQRRLGLDLEEDFEHISTTIADGATNSIAITTFKWRNAGGDPNNNILVVQVGDVLKFFTLESEVSVSPNLLYTYPAGSGSDTFPFSYSVVDGILVVVTGAKNPITFEFDPPNTFIVNTTTLLVRDLFGVEDVIDGEDLFYGHGLQTRPPSSTDAHTYNLVNQGWGVPRVDGSNETLGDPISIFYGDASNTYPSNSDVVTAALYADPEDTDNRTIDRFFAEDLVKNPLGSTKAAQGYFIIDALERGISRIQNFEDNLVRYPDLESTITDLPQDITPGGPTVVGEYAGRVWYGGFSGEVLDPDALSPRLSSYILFSKLVQNPSDINRCYQEGDPTSKFEPDIVDTDGGFIRLNEAYGIRKFTNVGPGLMVVATNGVWRVVGGTDTGFTATNYIVEKLTSNGCDATDSVVVANGAIFYWGEDGIYQLSPDQFGTYNAQNICKGRIQKLFDSISTADRRNVKGVYDSFERKIRWLYRNRTNDNSEVKELVLDIDLQAFYPNTIKNIDGYTARTVSPYVDEPYQIYSSDPTALWRREVGYVVITQFSPTIEFTFAKYRNGDFRDWYSLDGEGVDAAGYTVTSHLSGTDFIRDKEIPFLVVHLRRTETGFEDVGGEFIPINQSSCLVQVRWDWSDNNNSNRWSPTFQAYRYRRHYIPVDINDTYENGFLTIVTRNKIRGSGKVVSFKFSTEPYKDLHLYGWSMLFSVAGEV